MMKKGTTLRKYTEMIQMMTVGILDALLFYMGSSCLPCYPAIICLKTDKLPVCACSFRVATL
ncbi:TPA: hypothetical protein VGS93_003845 [Bacillus cereus]|uniref:hypothetical protein n=1 Tax=Bacillus thuringiensis TaxID=1428 RepID=UPI002B385618|nr:hypothetical protein [Bacillus cereus]